MRDLQAALHPPQPTPTLLPSSPPSPLAPAPDAATWRRTAHVALARAPRDACAAAMLFAQLARAGSPAARLLRYPAAWDAAPDPAAPAGRRVRRLGTAARLLRRARDRYGATLQAVPAPTGEATPEEAKPEQGEGDPAAALRGVKGYERLLWLRGPGLVRDARALDALFAAGGANASVVRWPGGVERAEAALLVRPGAEAAGEGQDTAMAPEEPSARALGSTAALQEAPADAEGSAAQGAADDWAYVRFDDPGVAGPEFDVPDAMLARARPAGEAGRAWDALYDEYRWLRMDVCGLDLEPLPASSE